MASDCYYDWFFWRRSNHYCAECVRHHCQNWTFVLSVPSWQSALEAKTLWCLLCHCTLPVSFHFFDFRKELSPRVNTFWGGVTANGTSFYFTAFSFVCGPLAILFTGLISQISWTRLSLPVDRGTVLMYSAVGAIFIMGTLGQRFFIRKKFRHFDRFFLRDYLWENILHS